MAIKDIGYEQDGFHWHNAKVEVLLHEQSADIAMGVDAGAATRTRVPATRASCSATPADETPALMPAPIQLRARASCAGWPPTAMPAS